MCNAVVAIGTPNNICNCVKDVYDNKFADVETPVARSKTLMISHDDRQG